MRAARPYRFKGMPIRRHEHGRAHWDGDEPIHLHARGNGSFALAETTARRPFALAQGGCVERGALMAPAAARRLFE
jgi:hypothetical protein